MHSHEGCGPWRLTWTPAGTGMSVAFVFPGQGSQSLGMMGGLAQNHPEVRATFDATSDVLGYDLWSLVQEGPRERLDETQQTQPAMLAAGVAAWRAWQAAGGRSPDLVAGHSLGEYSALVCAGSLDFAAALGAVSARARLMQAAVPRGKGAIAAVLGLDDTAIGEICTHASGPDGEQVWAVNYNAPGQVVVAGHAGAVARAAALAAERGARRVIPLPMSVPVHCRLMEPAASSFRTVLSDIEFRRPGIDVVHNADLKCHSHPDEIREALVRQLTRPVRWAATIEVLRDAGVRTLIEAGPGRVLTGLARRIDRSLGALSLHDPGHFDEALTRLA